MNISRDNQMILADIALRLLARGICAASMLDKRVASDVAALGDGFSFAVCAGLDEQAPAIGLLTENGRFVRIIAESVKYADEDGGSAQAQGNGHVVSDGSPPDVTISFKDVTGLIPVVLGSKSVETAFAQHRMLVRGNINQAVILVRIISIAETYLFPKFMIKKAMRRVPKKRVPSLFIYLTLPFFGVRKPQATAPVTDTQPEVVEEIILETAQEPEQKERLEAAK